MLAGVSLESGQINLCALAHFIINSSVQRWKHLNLQGKASEKAANIIWFRSFQIPVKDHLLPFGDNIFTGLCHT